jgi:hypothetical protein
MAPMNDERPVTYGDLDRWNGAIAERLDDLVREVRRINGSVASAHTEIARGRDRAEGHSAHLLAIQGKLDRAGIDGTERITGGVTPSLLGAIGIGLLTLTTAVAGAVAWLFLTFKRP